MSDPSTEVASIEVSLLLEGVYQRYGYDFREYARGMLERRVEQFLRDAGIASLAEAIGRVLREPPLFYKLIAYFSINVTELFRDPAVYAALRAQVVPMLRTWPHVKVWDAGCATGEEVYSLAILLTEEGLYERATLYATDINAAAIETARVGIYPLETILRGSRNYLASNAPGSMAHYYYAHGDAATLDAQLRRNVTFAQHNLAMDASFGEMQLIVCRNVLIYFNHDLQNQVLELFWESLENGGYLCLGDKESLSFSSVVDRFEVVSEGAKIYKKRFVR